MAERMICMNVTYVCPFIQKANKHIKDLKKMLPTALDHHVCWTASVASLILSNGQFLQCNRLVVQPIPSAAADGGAGVALLRLPAYL
jgi:hypothetical protein